MNKTTRLTAFILSILMLLSLCACGSKSDSAATVPAAASSGENESAPEATEAPYTGGSVYYINSDPSADAAWQQLASAYTAATRVPVTVKTISENYDSALSAEIDSADAPTAFAVNKDNYKLWKESCLDLSGTDLYSRLLSSDLAMIEDDGKVGAAAYTYDCCGILVNTDLLAKAGYSVDDIKNFSMFDEVLDDITTRKNELGFGAVAAPELTEDTWHYTECVMSVPLFYEFKEEGYEGTPASIYGKYSELFRNMWDAYIENCVTAVTRWHLDTLNADENHRIFGEQEAAFAIMASWEIEDYTDAYGLDRSKVTMLPFYCGYREEENAGLSCGNIEYWCVNREADADDVEATLAFLAWAVGAEGGAQTLTETYGIIPYAGAPEGSNPCLNAANAAFAAGKYNIGWVWDLYPDEQLEEDVLHYMINYTVGINAGENQWYDIAETLRTHWHTLFEQNNVY